MKEEVNQIHLMKFVIYGSVSIALLKLLAYINSQSLIVLASLFDSIIDIFVSFLNLNILKKSKKPADKQHPFGHGGYEVLSSFLQGILFLVIGINIIWQSIYNIYNGNYLLLSLKNMDQAIITLFISGLGAFVIHFYIKIKSFKNKSLTISSEIMHYESDIIFNFLAVVGLFIVKFTGILIIDPIQAILGGGFIIKTSYPVLKKSIANILHNEIDVESQQKIVNIAVSSNKLIKGIHKLRTRELGPNLFIDFHLKLPYNMSLGKAYCIGKDVSANIKKCFSNGDIIIHLEPGNEIDKSLRDPDYVINKPL